MDDIERRIAEALRAEASRVTEDSLRLPIRPEPPRPRRWPAMVAAAGVLATAAAVVAVLAVTEESQPRPMPPAQTTSVTPPPTSTDSGPVPTSSQIPPSNPGASGAGAGAPSRTSQPPPPPMCGGKPCQVVQSVKVGGDTLEVLAVASTTTPYAWGDWKVRVRGGVALPGAPTFDSFVSPDSLHCATVAGRTACLLHTWYLGDSDTSLGIAREASGWRFTGITFPVPYGAHSIDLRDLGGDRTLDVVSVESRFLSEDGGPERQLWTATVWRWDGTRLGCVPRVSTKEELPGWPNVAPDLSTVDARNCFS